MEFRSMPSRLITTALLLAALAAVACWHSEGQPACDESRPDFGARACCEGHKVAGSSAAALVEFALDPVALGAPQRAGGGRRIDSTLIGHGMGSVWGAAR